MLLRKEMASLERIEKQLESARRRSASTPSTMHVRRRCELMRGIVHLYSDVIRRCLKQGMRIRGADYKRLKAAAERALDELGCQAEPSAVSLKHYDHRRYGPFLGVSDEGSAAPSIRDAALASPKVRILNRVEPIVVGVAHDAERLGAVGEVAVGPDEYRSIRLACMDRILTSTNVGTRLNLRYFKRQPFVTIEPGRLSEAILAAEKEAERRLAPFLQTPDGKPRPLTVFARFEGRTPYKWKREVLQGLVKGFRAGRFCEPTCHTLGLVAHTGLGERGVRAVRLAIDLASETGLNEVAVEGVVRREAEDKISMPGLLNYFEPEQVSGLLAYAARKCVKLSPKNLVDTETVARSVWAGLLAARNMGLELGKYGLSPLTLSESDEVVGLVQGWFKSWTAAPALYVDFPIVDGKVVYAEGTLVRGIRKWLEMVASHGVPVVLIDTADKDKGGKLLKKDAHDDQGILSLADIAELDACAAGLGIKALWAGGLTIPQAYEMGKLQVFGIYVTTCASVVKPVSGGGSNDIMLPSEKEPTYSGVLWTKLLLEAGFLVTCLRQTGPPTVADAIDKAAQALIAAMESKKFDRATVKPIRDELADLLGDAWRRVFKQNQR